MTTSRSRVAIGVVTLVLAAGLLVAAPRLMPEQVAGTAESGWPAPPAVGACLTMPERGTVSVVPCDRPHDAEVTRNWAATDPVLDASPSSWSDRSCADAAAGYIGRAAGDSDVPAGPGETRWQPAGLAYQSFQLLAPEEQRAGSRGWRVCIVRPTVPVRYTGMVRDAAPHDLDQSAIPEAYRSCLDDYGNVQNCTLPHRTEVLARGTKVLDLQVAAPMTGPGQRPVSPDGDATDPGTAESGDAAAVAEAEARARADQIRGWNEAFLSGDSALQDAEKSLVAQCLDLAPGLVPALAPAPSTPRPTVGLSGSTAALGPSQGTSGFAMLDGGDPTDTPSSVLALGDAAGYLTVTASCIVTAPAGQQFSRSILGWQGDRLPLIPG